MSDAQASVVGLSTAGIFGVVWSIIKVANDEATVLEPIGWACFIVAIFMGINSVQAWRRARLRFMSLAMTIGALGLLAISILFMFNLVPDDLAELPSTALLILLALSFVPPLCLWLDSRTSPRKWQAWKAEWRSQERGPTILEILSGEHIPLVGDIKE